MATRDPGDPPAPGPPATGAPVHPGEPRDPGAGPPPGPPPDPGEPRDLDHDVDPAHPYRARQLAPYRRDAGLHDSGLSGRYPGLRGSGSRDPRVHASGPGSGAGVDRDPDRGS